MAKVEHCFVLLTEFGCTDKWTVMRAALRQDEHVYKFDQLSSAHTFVPKLEFYNVEGRKL
jgi:hypothetical protein